MGWFRLSKDSDCNGLEDGKSKIFCGRLRVEEQGEGSCKHIRMETDVREAMRAFHTTVPPKWKDAVEAWEKEVRQQRYSIIDS